jgi:hypothetical protein
MKQTTSHPVTHAMTGQSSAAWKNIAAAGAFAVIAILAVRHQINLLSYALWQDKTETIVAAKMLANGYRLYSEVFNHHGPLTFGPAYILEELRSSGVYGHRIQIAALQWLTIASVLFSPLMKGKPLYLKSILGAAMATVVFGFLPENFAHMQTYQGLCGMLVAAILAQYVLPSIIQPGRSSNAQVFTGNALIACLIFLATTYALAALALALAAFRSQHARPALAGLLAGAGFNLVFLAWIGSVPGYLAQAIYLNSAIMPKYLDLGPITLLFNALGAITRDAAALSIFAGAVLGLNALALYEGGQWPWRWALVGVALGSFLVRGFFTHELPYLYGVLTLLLLVGLRRPLSVVSAGVLMAAIVLVACVKLLPLLSADKQRIARGQIPNDTEFAALARKLTEPDDRIIAYSFNNFDYLMAKRLPASGQFFYLPWCVSGSSMKASSCNGRRVGLFALDAGYSAKARI